MVRTAKRLGWKSLGKRTAKHAKHARDIKIPRGKTYLNKQV